MNLIETETSVWIFCCEKWLNLSIFIKIFLHIRFCKIPKAFYNVTNTLERMKRTELAYAHRRYKIDFKENDGFWAPITSDFVQTC